MSLSISNIHDRAILIDRATPALRPISEQSVLEKGDFISCNYNVQEKLACTSYCEAFDRYSSTARHAIVLSSMFF
jgi:hypothetical protein